MNRRRAVASIAYLEVPHEAPSLDVVISRLLASVRQKSCTAAIPLAKVAFGRQGPSMTELRDVMVIKVEGPLPADASYAEAERYRKGFVSFLEKELDEPTSGLRNACRKAGISKATVIIEVTNVPSARARKKPRVLEVTLD